MTSVPSARAALVTLPRSGWFRLGRCPLVLSLFIAVAGSASPAQEAQPGWTAIAALFRERCIMCHSGEHAAVELHLDSYDGVVAGSKNGPIIILGDVSASELIRRVRGQSQPRMPFLGYPLDADEVALLEHWIEAGLPRGETAGSNDALAPKP